jgi:hypothetical protein
MGVQRIVNHLLIQGHQVRLAVSEADYEPPVAIGVALNS